MADDGGAQLQHAHLVVWPRGAAGCRSHDDARALPVKVVLYHAPGCHLCERAREVLLRVRAEQPFDLVEVDISGDEALEAAHRDDLPVVEMEGGRRFVYFVPEDAFRRALAAQSPR